MKLRQWVAPGITICTLIGMLLVVWYHTSGRADFNRTAKDFQAKRYAAVLKSVKRLPPKYRDDSRAVYMRKESQIAMAQSALEKDNFLVCLDLLADVHDKFPTQRDVPGLRRRAEAMRDAAQAERKRKAREKAVAAQRRAQRQQQAQRYNIEASVTRKSDRLLVRNENDYTWQGVRVCVNPGFLSQGYYRTFNRIVRPNDTLHVYYAGLANSKGHKFFSRSHIVKEVKVIAGTPADETESKRYYFSH